MLGIGLNVAIELETLPEDVRARAATLGRPPAALEATLAELLGALELRLAEPADATLAALRERDALAGRRVRWEGGEGTAAGIAGDGALVRTAAGETRLAAGEVGLARRDRGPDPLSRPRNQGRDPLSPSHGTSACAASRFSSGAVGRG